MAGDKLLTEREVRRRVPVSRATLHRRVREGAFPAPVKLFEDGRYKYWRESDIDALIDSRPTVEWAGADAPDGGGA